MIGSTHRCPTFNWDAQAYSSLYFLSLYSVLFCRAQCQNAQSNFTFSVAFQLFPEMLNTIQTFRFAKSNVKSSRFFLLLSFIFFLQPLELQQNNSNKWARGLLPHDRDAYSSMTKWTIQSDKDFTWQKWNKASLIWGDREKETCEEVGQHRIISTALSSVKSMVVKLQVRAGWAALSLTAECVLGNNPLLTSSTCHRGNAPFMAIYTAAKQSG